MNIRGFLKWTLVLLVALAFKQLQATEDPQANQPVYQSVPQTGK